MYILELKMDQPDCPVIAASREIDITYYSPFWSLNKEVLSARTYVSAIDNETLQTSLQQLELHPNMFKVQILSRTRGRALLKLMLGETSARSIILKNGGYVIGPFIVSNGWEIWQIAFDDKKNMEQAIYELDKSQNEFKILKHITIRLDAFSKIISHIDQISEFIKALENLTEEDRAVLISAIKFGYYDDPKKINLLKLANDYGLTPAGMSKKLRRIEKKIFSSIKPLLERHEHEFEVRKEFEL